MEQEEKVITLNTKAEPFIPSFYTSIVTPTAPADALLFDEMFDDYKNALSSTKRDNKESPVLNDKITNSDEIKAESNKPEENKKKKEKIIIPEKKFVKNESWIAKTNEEYKNYDDFKAGGSLVFGFPSKKWKKKENLINKEGNDGEIDTQINNEEFKCDQKEEIAEETKEERIGWPDIVDIKLPTKERFEESKAIFDKNEKKSQPSEDSWSNVESSGSEKTEEFQYDPNKKWADFSYRKNDIPTNKPKEITAKPEISNITAKPNYEEEEFIITTKENEETETPIEKPETKTVKIVPKPWPTATLNAVNSRSQKQTPQSGFQSLQPRSSQRIEIQPASYNPYLTETSTSQEFDLKTYKTKLCPKGADCKGPCMDYHYIGEKRRDPKSTYFPNLCKNAENCVLGDRCSKAHNLYEVLYHPQAYMTLECPFIKEGKECVMGKQCFFAHRKINRQNITIPEYQPRIQPQSVCGDAFHKLDQREKELEEYENRLRARCHCNRGIKKYMFVPCGHLICERCRLENRCVVCGCNGKSYMMH